MRCAIPMCCLLLGIGTPLFAETLHLEKTIPLQVGTAVRFTAIARTGNLVAGACSDQKIRVWDLAASTPVRSFDLKGERIDVLQLSPDSRLLAAGGDNGMFRLWDLGSGDLRLEFAAPARVSSIAISPDDRLLAVAATGSDVEIRDLEKRKVAARVHAPFGGTSALAFSPDNAWLVTADEDTNIRIYDAHTGSLRSTTSDVMLEEFTVAFSPDGKWIYAAGADRTITVIDAGSGKVVRSLPKQADAVAGISMSPDGTQLAAAYLNVDNSRIPAPVLIWDLAHDAVKTKVLEAGFQPNGGAFLSDGRLLMTSSSEKELKVWSAR